MTPRFVLYLGLLLIVALAGTINLKKLSMPFRLLTLLIGITFLSEVLSRKLAVSIQNSNPVYHFFGFIEYSLLAFLYIKLLSSKIMKKWVLISIPVMIVISMLNTLFFQTFTSFPSYVLIVSYGLLSILSLVLFIQITEYPSSLNILRLEVFWLNTIILFYCSSGFITLAFHNYMNRHHIDDALINTVGFWINIFVYAGMGVTILANARQPATVSE
jgi:hypothetical protein